MKKIIDIMSLIKEYLQERVGSHELYLEAATLFVVENAIGKISTIKYRYKEIPINLFLLLVGPTYIARKSSILELVRNLCIYPNIPGDITQQALVHTLEKDKGFGWQYIDEIGDIFEELKTGKSYSRKLYRTYLILFTGLPYERETVSGGKLLIEKPCFSILGATTPSKLLSTLSDTDIEGGFFPRFLTVWLNNKDINLDINLNVKYKISIEIILKELMKIKVIEVDSTIEYDNTLIDSEKAIRLIVDSGADEKTINGLESHLKKKLHTLKHGYIGKGKSFIISANGKKIIKAFREEIIRDYSGTPMMAFASNYENYLIKLSALYAAGENFDYFLNNNNILILDEQYEKARDFIIECLRKINVYYIDAITHSKDFIGAYRRAKTALCDIKPITIEEFHIATNTDKFTSDLVFDTINSQGLLNLEVDIQNIERYYIKTRKGKSGTLHTINEKVIDAIRNGKRRLTDIYRTKGLKRTEAEYAISMLVKSGEIIIYDETDRGVEIYKLPIENLKPIHRTRREMNKLKSMEQLIETGENLKRDTVDELIKHQEETYDDFIIKDQENKEKESKKHQEFLEREKKFKKKTE